MSSAYRLEEQYTACSRGCFACGPFGERFYNHEGTGCCGSTKCDGTAWSRQLSRWLKVERQVALPLWCAAEKEWGERLAAWVAAEQEYLAELRSRPAARVRHVRREEQFDKDPQKVRAQQKAR